MKLTPDVKETLINAFSKLDETIEAFNDLRDAVIEEIGEDGDDWDTLCDEVDTYVGDLEAIQGALPEIDSFKT